MTIYDLVARQRARIGRLVQLDTSLRVAVVGVSVLSLGAALLGGARWIALPRIVPFVVWAVAAGLAVLVAWRGARRFDDLTSLTSIADAVERERRLRAGSLRGLLELAGNGGAFVRRAARRLGVQLAALGNVLAPSLERRLRRGALAGMAVLLPVTFLAAFATGRRPGGWQALVHPLSAWRGTLLPRLEFQGAPRRAMRGAVVRFTVLASGRSRVSLRRRTTGNSWVETSLPIAQGTAITEVGPLDADLTLVASDGRSSSDTLVVRVVDRPFVGDVALRASYPGYLHRVAEALAVDGPVKVPGGTELWIEGHASEPLSAVALAQGRDSVQLTPNERRFSGRFTPVASGIWTWSARGRSASIAEVPPPLQVEVVTDSAPSAEIVDPSADTTVTPVAKVDLQLVASDDHGLQGVTLKVWRVGHDGKSTAPTAQRVAGGGIAEWSGRARLDIASFGLEAGDALHIQLVARDETPWGQEGTSRELVLRVLGGAEQRSSLRAAADAAALAAASAAQAQAQLQQRTSDASNQRSRSGDKGDRTSPAMQYEGAQQAKQLAAEQKQMSERVQQLQQAAKQLEERLRSAGALDTGLAAQLRQAQELLRQALTPEMLEALKKLDNSTQQLSADQTRQSLADLVAQQKKLREALEKSAEILKRAAIEGALQTLKDEAEELAREQREMADSLRDAATPPEKQLVDRTEQLSKDIQALMERLKREGADTAAKQAERAREQTEKARKAMSQQPPSPKTGEQKAAGEKRQESQEGGERQTGGEKQEIGGERQQSGQQSGQKSGQQSGQQSGEEGQEGGERSGAEEAAEAMEGAARALAEGRKAQVDQWKQELTGELDRSVQEMLQLARQQDALAQKARQNPSDGDLRSEQSALQEGVEKASDRLQEQSKRSALVSPRSQKAVGDAEQRVGQAARDASEPRNAGQMPASMSDAASALRQAAASLARDRERAALSNSASGLSELLAQLQQLARQQGALNGQMQSLFQKGAQQREGLSPDAKAQARSLARQQRDVANELDEAGDGDGSGRSAELAREARELARALEQGAVDPTIFERQQRLFTRMLDAGRTLENDQQDESSKRESRPGEQFNPFAPPNASASGRAAQKYRVPEWNELRGLNSEERRLVIEYFRRLNGERP